MFSRYFQSELTYLRELGREFSAANPSLSGLFAEQGGDPDVDRLLEGFAFLTARIRERIDDAVPEVVEALAELVVPQSVRPLPACSVLEFQPRQGVKQGAMRVPEGTGVASRPVEHTRCAFRTTADVHLLPLQVAGCTLDLSQAKTPAVRLRLQRRGPGLAEHGALRLFLHGPFGQTSAMHLWLMRHLEQVEVHGSEGGRWTLPPSALVPLGVAPDFRMLPWPEAAPEGLRLAQEYFTLAHKLLFVELRGLGVVDEAQAGDQLEVVFRFREPPPLPERVDDDLFRLHCVPVINTFEVSADPVTLDPSLHEHLLRASGVNPHHTEIYAVTRVEGLTRNQRTRRRYEPFYAFAHLQRPPGERGFYTLRRRRSPIDGAIDTYLSVMTPADVSPDLSEEVLSMDLVCTNRTLPTELRAGDIHESTATSPSLATFQNITGVSSPARPPAGWELHWRLVSHLALNTKSLTDPEALRALLAHYNLQTEVNHQVGRANQLRAEAIRQVRTEPARRIIDGIPASGFRTTLTLEQGAFASFGDAFLFGSVLQALFSSETPLNAFHQLVVSLHPSGREFSWDPITGSQPIF